MKNVNIFGENQVNFPSSPKSMGWGGVGCLGKSPIKMFWYFTSMRVFGGMNSQKRLESSQVIEAQ